MELPSSSSSPNPQTLPSPSNWEHDVFLSFRGEDTRNNFTDHLYYAMTQIRINVFRDTEKFQRGKFISPELLKAIEKSRFAVIVLSTNFATSTWCLDELAHIVECNKLRGMKVVPVFYHVEPSEIRKQTGNYGKAFAKHEINFKDNISKVENWREALKYIASFSGLPVTHRRSESEVIQEIVNQILNVLNKILYVPNGELVGMDARIKEIEYRLDLKSNDVLTIGIWGMGGIGKTTLAKEVFKKIRNPFHLTCFVSQVRLQSAVELQRRLCESFLEIGNINIDTVEKGIKLLKKALFKKKVLIILDDVDSFKQIECLAPGGPLGENIWGGGSRLIITTRDRSSLRDFYVQENDIYEVEKLSDEEAFQLLCKKAFRKENPPEEFVALSKSFLQYAGGLPLAHKVLGSYLSRLKVDRWSHILHRLDDEWNKDIFGVLQISFDGLQDTDKKIFLDIACFFNGEDLVRVKNILKGCGFSSGIGINNLIDKSLIRVEKNKLWMHDLLRCLGWHIVRGESSFPGERSRLWVDNNALKYESRSSWRFKDARNVLMDNTGTAAVESLFLSLPEREDMSLKDDPFLTMCNLRLLKIYNVNFLGVHFRHISRQLRILEWHECPLQFLPHNFKSVKLVEIKMPNSRIEQLWNEKMCLGMLTLMDLSHCQYLATTPDFSQVPNLERLILQGCKVLSEVHHTIGNLQKLKFLNLKGCTSLESLPQSISLSSLEIFILSGCSKLQDFPQSVQNMDTLSELYLDGTAIQVLPLSMQYLQGLVLLNLNGCSNFLGLPSILCSSLTSLKFLYLSLCSSMVKLPDNIGCLEHLEELDASHTAIRKVPESIFLLKNLKLLCFHGCSGFTGLELPNKFSGLRSLTTLNLGGCNLAEGAIPDDIGDLVSLQSLDLSENNFVTIPESISKLSELTEISLSMCSKLQSLPHIPSSLRNLNLHGCPMLTNSSSNRINYSSEKGSSIVNCRKTEQEDDEKFPSGNLEEPDDDTLDSDRVYASEGAGGGLLFTALCDLLKELISKSMIYGPLLKDILSALDSYRLLIKQIEASNEELGYRKEEVEKFKAHMKEGIKIVEKCSKARKWNIWKNYKYVNKLLGWDSARERLLKVLQAQGVRDGKKTLLSVKRIERTVTEIEMNSSILESGVEILATTSSHMEKALSGVEMRSGDMLEGMYRIEDRVETNSCSMEAGIKRIEDCLDITQFTVGLDEPLQELKMKLLKDGVSMLVVTAPVGCGKTTLATKFCQDGQVKDKFKNNIFFVTVSNTPNLGLIVQELHNRKGSQVPTFQDEITAVKWLQTFLKEQGRNPLLLVLDDVWSGSESLLDKFQFDMPDYKILVTSRSEFPRFGSSYHLQLLDYDNAMKLFYHSASLGDKSSHIPAYLSRLIVEGCKGYPLAITVAGGSLCGQSIEIWKQRLIEWSKGSSILDSETELLLRLQSSIVVSDKEMAIIRECFLDLGSFPEDQRIPVTALIDMWTELYEQLDEDTLCVAYLQRLTNRSLANLVVTRKDQTQGDGYYSEHFVTQHNFLRELAIYETRQQAPGDRERLIINIIGNNLPKWWMEDKYKSMKARLLSISTDGNFSSKWHHMELPEAEVLVLNFKTKNYALPKFVDTMHKLKVLVVTNDGFSPAELSNTALLGSKSHLKRIRLERVSISSITKNPVQFVCLKKISLFMCTIGKAFSDSSIQFSCTFPNLEEISIDYCNDLVEMPADLCDLVHLRKLSVTNSHKLLALPEEIGKLENLELLRLRSCTDLEQLPGSSRNLKKLTFLDVSYCFSIKEFPEDIGEMSSLKKLNMRECSRLQEVPVSFLDLQHLEEVICDDETRNLWEPFLPLENTRIVVEKGNINLNWLHKLHF